jgi:hypothetical protein
LLPERVSPELRHLQAKLAVQLPYRQAAAIPQELLPETGDLNHATTRNRTFAVGKRIEQEICDEMDHPRLIPSQPSEWWWGSMAHSLSGAYSSGPEASV